MKYKSWPVGGIIGLVILVGLVTGCPVEQKVHVYPLGFDFGNGSETAQMSITGVEGQALVWRIESAVPWLSFSSTSGMGSATVTLTADLEAEGADTDSFSVVTSAGTVTVVVTRLESAPSSGDTGDDDTGDGDTGGDDDTTGTGELRIYLPDVTLADDDMPTTVSVHVSDLDPDYPDPPSSDPNNPDVPDPNAPEQHPDGSFIIENVGDGSVTWMANLTDEDNPAPAWLDHLSVTGGTLEPGTQREVDIYIDEAEIATSETYVFTITSNASNNDGELQVSIGATKRVKPAISVDPGSIDFGTDNSSEILYVANSGDQGTTLHFEVSTIESCWLFVSPLTGTSVRTDPLDWQPIGVTVYRGGLTEPTAAGLITVRESRGDDYPDVVHNVQVSVEAAPISFEGARPWIQYPNVAYPFLLRDIKDRSIHISSTPVDGRSVIADLQSVEDGISVYEDGQILELTETQMSLEQDYRINLVLVLDYSGSMDAAASDDDFPDLPGVYADPMHDVYMATVVPKILENTTDLPADTAIKIVAMYDRNGGHDTIHDFTTDRDALENSLAAYTPPTHGASEILPTLLTEATLPLITRETNSTGNTDAVLNVVMLISDGRQTTPPGEVSDLTTLAEQRHVRFYTISWGADPNHEFNARLASESDGQFYPAVPLGEGCGSAKAGRNKANVAVASTEGMADALESAADDLGHHMVLRYVTLNENPQVKIRFDIQVDVTRQDGTDDNGDPVLEEETVRGSSRDYDINLSATPTFEVESPASGDTLIEGDTYTIRWSSSGVPSVGLALYKDGVLVQTITSSTEDDGRYEWTVPTTLDEGDDYTIMVYYNDGTSTYYDESDEFSIRKI